ncbi:MAG: Gfo/Idh/MocA family oxidoreductase [Pirellulaceae bacterium]|nr:Gfo/Idh/MocA family oxidoreductase [Pirellulaceae bacterium]
MSHQPSSPSPTPHFITRRQFTASSIACCASTSLLASDAKKKFRVGVVGHTGRGDYGHGLNTMWLGIPEAEIAAVADPVPKGLASATKLLGGVPGFEDYRRMLKDVKPDLVAIGMRHVDQHHEVAMAAIDANVRGIYIEKPFCRSPEEADQIIAAAKRKNVKVAIAHRNRYHPVLPVLKQLIEEGAIGRLLEYRMRGKEDTRGGMLDLWVLGSHLVNLVHYFAGPPKACSGTVLIDQRPAKQGDAMPGAEGIGLMAGNEVHARFEMTNGVPAFFESIVKAGTVAAGFGLQIIGTEGTIDLRIDREPLAHIRRGSPFLPTAEVQSWEIVSSHGIGIVEPIENLGPRVAKHWLPGEDLIQAINDDRQPLCSGEDGATTIEMATAVSTSHLQNGARIELPHNSRTNPWLSS